MSINIFFGLGGSRIKSTASGITFWSSGRSYIAASTASGITLELTCNPDGTSKFPAATPGITDTGRRFAELCVQYNPPDTTLQFHPYDWRMSPQNIVTQQMIDDITEPSWFIGYSYGGRVILQIWNKLLEQNKQDLFLGGFFVGSPLQPQLSNWSAVQCLDGRGETFQGLWQASNIGVTLLGWVRNAYGAWTTGALTPKAQLQSMVASWDSFGCLVPQLPELLQASWWTANTSTTYATQDWLDRGAVSNQSLFATLPPRDKVYNIYSPTFATANNLNDTTPQGDKHVQYGEKLTNRVNSFIARGLDHDGLQNSEQIVQWIFDVIKTNNNVQPQDINPLPIPIRVTQPETEYVAYTTQTCVPPCGCHNH